MNAWILEPTDPTIFRDGRPFSGDPGAQATSLPMPLPGTIIGGIRTRAGLDEHGRFDSRLIPQLLLHELLGPLVVALNPQGGVRDFFMAAPADAVLYEGEDRATPLVPVTAEPGCQFSEPDLGLVAPLTPNRSKPTTMPNLWSWERAMLPWLLGSSSPLNEDSTSECPPAEARFHVAMDPSSGTAIHGGLFRTEGRRWWSDRRLAMWIGTTAQLYQGTAQLGGERRFVRWRGASAGAPSVPDDVVRSAKSGFVRVILATPAHFVAGSAPAHLLHTAPDGTELIAQCHGRAVTISGWDFAQRRPKPTRRLVPSGAVFFLSLGGTPQERERWVRESWLRCISDEPQTRRDGFGLALLGVWDGHVRPLTSDIQPRNA